MKKILAVLLAAMMTATAFAGCGSGEGTSQDESNASSSSTELSVNGSIVDYSYFGTEDNATLTVWAPDAAVSLVQKQVEDFKAAYPEKTFNITVKAQGESDAATAVLTDAEVAADVFAFPSDQLNKLVNAGVLAKVAFVDAVKEQHSEATVEAGTIDGTLYAYPETNDNGYYLVYNKADVTDEDAKTLEGTLAACKAAGKKFIMDCGDGFYSCTFAFTGGAKIDGLEEDGETQKFVDYDEDEVVDTLMAFARLIKEYKGTFTSLNVKQVASGLKSGECAAGVDGSWDTTVNRDALGDNFGAAKLPTINVNGEDKQLISMFGYKYIGVNGSSQYPASSQILAYYLSGKECQEQRVEELGWGPSNKEVQASEVVTNDPALQAISLQASNACPQVNIASTLWSPMGNLGNKLVSESWDPEDRDATQALFEETIKNIRDEG